MYHQLQQDPRFTNLLRKAKDLSLTITITAPFSIQVADTGALVELLTGALVINGVPVSYAPHTHGAELQPGPEAPEDRYERYEVVSGRHGSYVLDRELNTCFVIKAPF